MKMLILKNKQKIYKDKIKKKDEDNSPENYWVVMIFFFKYKNIFCK